MDNQTAEDLKDDVNPNQEEPQNQKPPNLKDLLKTNPEAQKEYDREITRQRNEAQAKERKRQQDLTAANLSRAEKEALMNDSERAAMYKREAEELRNQIARSEEVRQLTATTNAALEEGKIPIELFNEGLDYYKTDNEAISDRLLLYSKYEFYPKGTFETRLAEAVEAGINERLKQKAPQTNIPSPQQAQGMELKPFVMF
ncbi:MAG: hypothetical protein FWD01_01740 [Defluviitaleaceae bacterium]|nr:hypothetical protein [Defluviitaleaceae bacterium]